MHDRLLAITTDFAEIVARKNLKLTKGQIVASTLHRAKILAKSLSVFGLTYTPSTSSRDIGVSCTAGSSRPGQLLSTRPRAVKKRISKVKNLARVSRTARKLFNASAYPAATFGHPACGLTPDQLLKLERNALSCTGISPHGRCRETSLVVAFGLQGTPSARIIRETVQLWFQLLNTNSFSAADLTEAWKAARVSISNNSKPHKEIHGIMCRS